MSLTYCHNNYDKYGEYNKIVIFTAIFAGDELLKLIVY